MAAKSSSADNSAADDATLDRRLFVIVCIVLGVLIALMAASLVFQWQNYHAGIASALAPQTYDHAAVLAYSAALDSAFVKISGLFLGFLLVLIGALYVLRRASTDYKLNIEGGEGKRGALETTSPGLVMITLGVVLITVSILKKTEMDYESPPPRANEQMPTGKFQPFVSDDTELPPSQKGK